MMDCTLLNRNSIYLIANEQGEWRFSASDGSVRPKYIFWRYGLKDPSQKVRKSLSYNQVQERVWEKVESLNLSNLEAFNNL